ncbi:Lsr2 family protein [Kitasatospora sp. NPDC088783]|uniref:histone-like nucleoid-structuring protein Lsr2 n=1 Tax=Kitasatospora sp. NPDC088783 TaxID=3364077 RepID=UPI003821C06B
MAQRIQVLLEDDLTGGTADETVLFALDGQWYEIDLSSTNAEELRGKLAPFTSRGRKARGPQQRAGRQRAAQPAAFIPDARAIRVWARENGHKISARGRLPLWLVREYNTRSA